MGDHLGDILGKTSSVSDRFCIRSSGECHLRNIPNVTSTVFSPAWGFAAPRAAVPAPTGRNPHDRVLLRTPPIMKVQFRDGARLGPTPPSGVMRRQGNADLRSAQPAAGGRQRRTPSSGRSPLGRDPGVQRHPDGCVVHAFRCAPRSGAGPHRENWPEVGAPLPACSFARWGGCREGSHQESGEYAASSRYARRCRPEVGVPSRPRAFCSRRYAVSSR